MSFGKYTPRRDLILAGKYRLLRPIAEGGMGVIWRAEHLSLGTPIAIKLMQPALEQDEDFQECFFQEARIAAHLRSPHVVQILDFGIHMHSPFIAMELLEGESLSQRLLRDGPLSLRECQHTLKQVARALSVAHARGVVHCDLKPENVFLLERRSDDFEPGFVKVLDFGIARAHPSSAPLEPALGKMLAGTPIYMSPEQLHGRTCLPGSDIWALGVLAFECLTGDPPLPNPSENPTVRGLIPPGFEGWFARACANRPEGRYDSIRSACCALLALEL